MVEDVVTPSGPYRLRLMCRSGAWRGPLADGSTATAWQRPDGRVVVRADDRGGPRAAPGSCSRSTTTRPPSTGASSATRCSARPRARSSATGRCGSRPSPTRRSRAMCGQLIEAGRAAAIERSILRAARRPPSPPATASPGSQPRRPPPPRARDLPRDDARPARPLARSRAPARARHGRRPAAARPRARHRPLVGRRDRARGARPLRPRPRRRPRARQARSRSLTGRWVEAGETAELLAPYEEWQGLAGQLLMLGWSRGLIPGADPDSAAGPDCARSAPPDAPLSTLESWR